jgi:hypothetical protein
LFRQFFIEAVGAYYQDWANRPERARQEARSTAYEALAARYPDDDEAQSFSALYIAGTQSQGVSPRKLPVSDLRDALRRDGAVI